VVGASANPHKGGYALVANLKVRFPERLYPVNPSHEEVCGLRCYPGVEELPETADLAILFVPAPSVPSLIEACGKRGIRRIMIQSAGFSETGKEGRRLQEACLRVARAHNIRLWGPNCMGIVDGHSSMVASFMRPEIWKGRLRPGGVSLIVQSGMLSAGFLMQILSEGYFGLAKACSIGNRSDVNECDLLDFFRRDPDTQVVAMYLESLIDPPRFRKAVGRLDRPVVLLKGGLSAQGARAALSHTGSLAGDAAISEGFLRQLGVYRAHDFVQLMDLTRAVLLWGRKLGPRSQTPPRIAVVTFSGAAGIVATDHMVRRGMELARLSPETLRLLKQVFPPWMEPQNPVDIWPAIERSGPRAAIGKSLEALVRDPEVDGIYLHLFVDRRIQGEDLSFLAPMGSGPKPGAIWTIGDTGSFRAFRERMAELGIPTYLEVARGVEALALLGMGSRRKSPSAYEGWEKTLTRV